MLARVFSSVEELRVRRMQERVHECGLTPLSHNQNLYSQRTETLTQVTHAHESYPSTQSPSK